MVKRNTFDGKVGDLTFLGCDSDYFSNQDWFRLFRVSSHATTVLPPRMLAHLNMFSRAHTSVVGQLRTNVFVF